MRFCYDSINPFDIPLFAPLVAGYVDGIFGPNHAAFGQPGWDAAGWAHFPNAIHVGIAISASTNAGVVGDVETGDMLPWEAPGWVLMRRAAGVDPTVYVNLSNWNATRTEFHLRGIPEPHWWLALYDGITDIPAGTVAKQYANSARSGGHYDLSVVADYWPGVDRPGGTAGSEILGGTMTPQQETQLLADVAQIKAWLGDVHGAGSRLEEAFGTATPAGPNPNPPNYLGFVNNELRGAIAKIDALTLTPTDLKPVLDAIHNLTLKAS